MKDVAAIWREVDRDTGEIEMCRLQRGEILKKIRSVSERAFRDGLAVRGLTVEYGEELIRNFELSEVKQ